MQGSSVYLLYYILRPENVSCIGGGKQIFKFSQTNLMQQPGGKSILAAKAAQYHRQPVSQIFEELLLSLQYHGFIMIEVRLDGDKAYMIEANPRFWGPSQLFVDAGVNFFELFLREYGFLEKTPASFSENPQALYFWHGGTVPVNGRPPVFFDGFEQEYSRQVLPFLAQDVYRRSDTAALFVEYF